MKSMGARSIFKAVSTAAFGVGLVAAGATTAPAQDELPFLTDQEIACQANVNDAVRIYLNDVFAARHDCFLDQMRGDLSMDVDCRASVDDGTGDDDVDAALRLAADRVFADVTSACFTVDLTFLGFPGTCDDEDGGVFSAFNLEACLRNTADEQVDFLLGFEQPAVVQGLEGSDRNCQDDISRRSARMFIKEYEARSTCSLKQARRQIDAGVDCRAEAAVDAPATGDNATDNAVVSAHNRILNALANDCPSTDLVQLGFPNQCPAGTGEAFPLFSLVNCMFDSHNDGLTTFLDVSNPLTKNCGNGIIDQFETCDDGDDQYAMGDVCRATCTANVGCGAPLDSGRVTINDALFILSVAVGLNTCELALCDIDGNGMINTTDVLTVIRFVVGLDAELNCPEPVIPGIVPEDE